MKSNQRQPRRGQSKVAADLVGVLALSVLLGLSSASFGGGKRKPATAKDQIEFGIEMAQRGLWSEALFRFEQAGRMDPSNPTIINNLAVAHEALGLFDEALELYRQALKLAPSNRGLKRNYARFVEFYQSFKPPEEEPSAEGEVAPAKDPTETGG